MAFGTLASPLSHAMHSDTINEVMKQRPGNYLMTQLPLIIMNLARSKRCAVQYFAGLLTVNV